MCPGVGSSEFVAKSYRQNTCWVPGSPDYYIPACMLGRLGNPTKRAGPVLLAASVR